MGVQFPVAATPDEDFHLASTWCGLGERAGLCEDPQDGTTGRLVPAAIPPATCYAFHPDESAACWDPDQTGLTRVDRANADGLYPKVFYAVMSVFASPNVAASVMAMRLFNAAFAVGLLTVVFWALPRWMRPALFVSVAATSVPLGGLRARVHQPVLVGHTVERDGVDHPLTQRHARRGGDVCCWPGSRSWEG
ncbi:DUF2142 domain-containing protein [Microbacterium aurum]